MICEVLKEDRELFEGVIGVVEANSFEAMVLWKEYKVYRPGKVWDDARSGPLITIGRLNDRPICISIFVHTIDGHRVAFMEPTSLLVDHKMIEEWLLAALPDSALHLSGTGSGERYINKVDAMNFYNVFPR